jgi:hypothetical protein
MDNILIILTSTVNVNHYKYFLFQTDPNERINTYLKSIKQWLENTNFRICLVENSGYTFPELDDDFFNLYKDRFEVITFDENTLPHELQHLKYNNSKGASEMYSIIHAFNASKFKSTTDFIIKITARYYIPDFEFFLLSSNIQNRLAGVSILDNDKSIIGLRQSCDLRCEILGIHKKFFNLLFELNLSDEMGNFYPHVETVYRNRLRLLNQDKILVCPTFNIEPTQMGGIKCISTSL